MHLVLLSEISAYVFTPYRHTFDACVGAHVWLVNVMHKRQHYWMYMFLATEERLYRRNDNSLAYFFSLEYTRKVSILCHNTRNSNNPILKLRHRALRA